MPDRRTAQALLEDRANRVDKALRALAHTHPGDTPPATVAALCKLLRERLDAALVALEHPAGQISLSRILQAETPERRVPVGGIG